VPASEFQTGALPIIKVQAVHTGGTVFGPEDGALCASGDLYVPVFFPLCLVVEAVPKHFLPGVLRLKTAGRRTAKASAMTVPTTEVTSGNLTNANTLRPGQYMMLYLRPEFGTDCSRITGRFSEVLSWTE